MEKIDLRTLDSASREVLRRRGIAMIKQGVKKGVVALFLGVNNTSSALLRGSLFRRQSKS